MKNTVVRKDRGRVLVHDIASQPRNYWHEIDLVNEVFPSRRIINYRLSLRRQGYGWHRGYVDHDGVKWDVYGRAEAL